jgi:ribosomal protein L11 methyltransferase
VIRLALRVRRSVAELVLAEMLELAPSGVEEIEIPHRDGTEGIVEYAVYGAAGELPELPDLHAAAGGALVEISTTEIPDDWSERWKQFHRPVLIEPPALGGVEDSVPTLHVRPPWEAPSDRAGVREIVIDPAQAFGTGAHATTHLCLSLLLELALTERTRGPVLDVGAGSGVLAIAAAKLGYSPIVALDNDQESVHATVANATVNEVEVQARRFDLRREALPEIGGAPAPVMLANLLKPLLHDLAAAIVSPPRQVIASGLLRAEADGVVSAFRARHGMREHRRVERGEWAAIWLSGDRQNPRSPRGRPRV